jgi:hypothetical protein
MANSDSSVGRPISSGSSSRIYRIWVTLLAAVWLAAGIMPTAASATSVPSGSEAQSSCLGGTGAPLPSALASAGAAGCKGHTAMAPTNENESSLVALEAGARPVVQVLPGMSATGLAAGIAPLAQTPGSRESFYWYSLFETKTEPKENCWQTGALGASSYACDSVGASFLPSGPHMHEVSTQGVGEEFQISPSGDYCDYYRLGEGLNATNANKQSGYTGYEPPAPLSSYQEGNSHVSPPNACQAYETFWGHVLQGSGNSKCEALSPCGMQHYVSLHEQGGSDRPWSSSFGEPSLVVSADVLPRTLGTHGAAWGYLCPLFEDQTTGVILEYCLEEWRVGSGFPATNESFDVVSACASGGSPVHAIDQTITQFGTGTKFAENIGSETTFRFESNSTWRDFKARITEADLKTAITADRRNHHFSKTEEKEAEEGKRSWSEQGCGENLSTGPSNYALVGIENGMEAGGISELGGSEANLQLWTEYTPLPPEATTGAATEVQQTQAKLNGTVNPKGTDTHYYFQYGETEAYGSTTSEVNAGSGLSPLPTASTATNLTPGTTYHFRLVAHSGGGTSYGGDQSFTTPFTVAFNANGVVYTYSSTSGTVDTYDGVMKGTSPSVAALAGGGYVVAFNANGVVYTYSSTSGTVDTYDGVMKGTSPSVAALAGGGYVVAFNANGVVYTYSSTSGTVDTYDGVTEGTSPSAGGHVVAFNANGVVYTYSSTSGTVDTYDGVMKGTSPSVT